MTFCLIAESLLLSTSNFAIVNLSFSSSDNSSSIGATILQGPHHSAQ